MIEIVFEIDKEFADYAMEWAEDAMLRGIMNEDQAAAFVAEEIVRTARIVAE